MPINKNLAISDSEAFDQISFHRTAKLLIRLLYDYSSISATALAQSLTTSSGPLTLMIRFSKSTSDK